jgi:hypothetical protein
VGFDSGSFSFQMYRVAGGSSPLDQGLLDRFAGHTIAAEAIGLPPEVEWGWCTGRSVLDVGFSFDRNVFNGALSLGLRVDTNKVPGPIKRAWLTAEQDLLAAGNPSGFISKAQRSAAKEKARRTAEDELRSGRHRRSAMHAVLWDHEGHVVYGPASASVGQKLCELFERTTLIPLEIVTSGWFAESLVENLREDAAWANLRPTPFFPPQAEQQADYPWTSKGASPRDYVGNEFLLWLWHAAEEAGGVRFGDQHVSVLVDSGAKLDCAFGASGRDTVINDTPGRAGEVFEALRAGKVPRQLGLALERGGHYYNCVLTGESLAVKGLRLPDVDEADNPRTLFEERVTLLRDFTRLLTDVFAAFLRRRLTADDWEADVRAIRKWVNAAGQRVG